MFFWMKAASGVDAKVRHEEEAKKLDAPARGHDGCACCTLSAITANGQWRFECERK
jgi:hypothetical protein